MPPRVPTPHALPVALPGIVLTLTAPATLSGLQVPGGVMRFWHEVGSDDDGTTTVVHGGTISGIASPMYHLIFRGMMVSGLYHSTKAVAQLAHTPAPPPAADAPQVEEAAPEGAGVGASS